MITFAYVFLAENPRCLGHTRLSCKVLGTKQAIAKVFELLCKKGGGGGIMDQVTKSEVQLFFITIITLILCLWERARKLFKSHFVC